MGEQLHWCLKCLCHFAPTGENAKAWIRIKNIEECVSQEPAQSEMTDQQSLEARLIWFERMLDHVAQPGTKSERISVLV